AIIALVSCFQLHESTNGCVTRISRTAILAAMAQTRNGSSHRCHGPAFGSTARRDDRSDAGAAAVLVKIIVSLPFWIQRPSRFVKIDVWTARAANSRAPGSAHASLPCAGARRQKR